MIACLARKLGHEAGAVCAREHATVSELATHLVEQHDFETPSAARAARVFAELAELEAKKAATRSSGGRRCNRCGLPGHYATTCGRR